MLPIEVVFYADDTGQSPVLNCFEKWPGKVTNKFFIRLERLEAMGHGLRRPEADFLRNGIYELRVRHLNVNYRILYFFHRKTAVLVCGITKKDVVNPNDIDRAIEARAAFGKNPVKHKYRTSKHD